MGYIKTLFVLVVLIACTLISSYFAGLVFLILEKHNPFTADLWTWYGYVYYYYETYPGKLQLSGLMGAGIGYGIPIFLYLRHAPEKRALHGEARFAKKSEILNAGLLGPKGILVGKYEGKYLTFPGQEFVLLAAPTRSGKGVGVVIPNCLNYPDSLVVLDIKQENFNKTAGFRKKHGQEVYLFNPFAEDYRTHRYNPLGYVRDGTPFMVGDILTIANVLYPRPADISQRFWPDQASNLFLGVCLYLFETPGSLRTIGEVFRQGSGKGKPIKDHLASLIEEREKSGQPLSEACTSALSRFMSQSDNTLAGILGSFNAPLTIWANPIVDAATSDNDFRLTDLRRKRMTIFVGITPDYLEDSSLLINLFFSQLVNLNTKELPENNPELKYPCLLLMDEFTALGKVQIIAKAVSYIAGYNLRLLPIIQSISQLESVYGREDSRTFVTNHACQVVYAPREQKDANEVSEALGYLTVKSISKSRSGGIVKNIFNKGSVSESESDQKRALLLPQEVKELGKWKEIILIENTKPIMCDKIKYFEDPTFTERLIDPPSIPLIDLDKHMAMTEARSRPVRMDDFVNGGIDLNNVTADLSDLVLNNAENPTDEDVENFVDNFFGRLYQADSSDGESDDDSGLDNGIGEAVEADENALENA